MQENTIRFKSCFICEVEINDKQIELIDANHMSFFIDKSNEETMVIFKDWFKNAYKSCIPQTLTIIQYDVVKQDDETFFVVKNLIYNEQLKTHKTIICESK